MTNIIRLKQGETLLSNNPFREVYEVALPKVEDEQPIDVMVRKVGRYKDKPRIVLQNKILFKYGFNFGVGIRLITTNNGLIIKTHKKITTLHVSKCLNHGVYLPTIDIKHCLENFTMGGKVKVKYYQDKIVLLKEEV